MKCENNEIMNKMKMKEIIIIVNENNENNEIKK